MEKFDNFYDNLKEKGYKFTSQRKIVLDALLEQKDNHVTIEELYTYIKNTNPKIGLTTVYRTVQLLCDMKLLEKVNLDDGLVRYELLLDDDNHRHHHLICNRCNQVVEVKEDLMDSIEKIFEENYGFIVSDHKTKFYGLCNKCRNEN